MKKSCAVLISILTICSYSANVFAVGAPDATAAIHAQTIWQKANATIQNNELYQTVLFLKKNYDQTKEYYDYVQEINKYKGGIGAYCRDALINAYENTKKTAINDLQSQWDDPDVEQSTYVDEIEKFVSSKKQQLDKKIDDQIDKLFKQQKAKKEAQEIRADNYREYMNLVARNDLSKSERDRMNALKGILEVNLLEAIHLELATMNAREAQRELNQLNSLKNEDKSYQEIEKMLKFAKEREAKRNAATKKRLKEVFAKGVQYGK